MRRRVLSLARICFFLAATTVTILYWLILLIFWGLGFYGGWKKPFSEVWKEESSVCIEGDDDREMCVMPGETRLWKTIRNLWHL